MRHLTHITAALLVALALAATATAAGTTHMRVVLAHSGPRLSGPTQWRAGLVQISATSQLADQEVNLLHFRAGYTYADFLTDGKKAQGHTAAARAAIAHVYANTIFDGGLNLYGGQSASFTVSLKAGTYYLGEMTARPQLTAIHVTGSSSASVHSAATITATGNDYRVSRALPANGTTTFMNAGNRPHRINLIPIKPGTTRAQVVAYLRKYGAGENSPAPPFGRNGAQIGTADLSPGQRMQIVFHLRAGTYAAIDLDTDMHSGRPEALEGFVTVLTVR